MCDVLNVCVRYVKPHLPVLPWLSPKMMLGFLNPFLYKNPDVFFDVTVGSNKVGRGGPPLPYGFNCSVGWDPVTGLGTPHFQKLTAAAFKAQA